MNPTSESCDNTKIFALQRFVVIIIGEHEVKQGFFRISRRRERERENRGESLLVARALPFSLVFTLKMLYRIIQGEVCA